MHIFTNTNKKFFLKKSSTMSIPPHIPYSAKLFLTNDLKSKFVTLLLPDTFYDENFVYCFTNYIFNFLSYLSKLLRGLKPLMFNLQMRFYLIITILYCLF
jgi:hypothetical protein